MATAMRRLARVHGLPRPRGWRCMHGRSQNDVHVSPSKVEGATWTPDSFAQYLDGSVSPFVAFVHNRLSTLYEASKPGPCYLRFLEKMHLKNAPSWGVHGVEYACQDVDEFNHLTESVLPTLGERDQTSTETFLLHAPIAYTSILATGALPAATTLQCVHVMPPPPAATASRGLTGAIVHVPYPLLDFIKTQPTPNSIEWVLDNRVLGFPDDPDNPHRPPSAVIQLTDDHRVVFEHHSAA